MSKGRCLKCTQENEYSKVICDFCGVRLPWADAVVQPQPTRSSGAPLVEVKPSGALGQMPTLGRLFLGGGILGALYFFFFFDTTVEVPRMDFLGTRFGGGRVNNFGLLQQQHNGLLISIAVAALGAFLIYNAQRKAS